MHPTEILDHYREIEIDKILHPDKKLFPTTTTKNKPLDSIHQRRITRIYPPIERGEDLLYACYFCKNNELSDNIEYRYNTDAVFASADRLKHHYTRYHKNLVKVIIRPSQKPRREY